MIAPGHGVKMLKQKYEFFSYNVLINVLFTPFTIMTDYISCYLLSYRLVVGWLSYSLKRPIYSHLRANHQMIHLTFDQLSDMKWELCRKNNSNDAVSYVIYSVPRVEN